MFAIRLLNKTFPRLRQQISTNNLPMCLGCVNQNTGESNVFGCKISRRHYGTNALDIISDWINSQDEETQKRLKLIQMEIVNKHQTEMSVPALDTFGIDHYQKMLNMSFSKRQQYYINRHKTHYSKENFRIKNEIRQALAEQYKQGKLEAAATSASENKHIQYGLGKNALLIKIYPRTINKWKNHKLLRAMRLGGQKLIFDCGFDDLMTNTEISSAAKQLTLCFSDNRNSRNPYVFHFVNMNYDGPLWYHLKKWIPTIEKKSFPIGKHTECFSELFPKDNLVYLTPDSDKILDEFNPCDHYIIGGIVDKGDQKPLTLAKAKKLDIRTARLPLDNFVKFKGTKSLTLNQMNAIMLEVKGSRDWGKAFEYIARRKIL